MIGPQSDRATPGIVNWLVIVVPNPVVLKESTAAGRTGPSSGRKPHIARGRRAFVRTPPSHSLAAIAYSASGSGRIWNFTTLLIVPLPVSLWNGARVAQVDHSPLPFHPAFGSSILPSIPLAKKPVG